MATITARVVGTGPGDNPGDINVILEYALSQAIGAANNGQAAFPINQAQTDQEIEASLRTQLAEFISGLAGQTFTDADVRGCKF